jgi:hypothetical protein
MPTLRGIGEGNGPFQGFARSLLYWCVWTKIWEDWSRQALSQTEQHRDCQSLTRFGRSLETLSNRVPRGNELTNSLRSSDTSEFEFG